MSIGGKIATECSILLLIILFGGVSFPALAQSTCPEPSNTERFVNAGPGKLHYVDRGSGRVVVMIHGNAGDLRDFEFGTLDLVARSYRVVAFDLPGHGLSKMNSSAKGTIQEQAVILHQAITELQLKDPILVGHSWGGAVALAYALLYPNEISGLVLLAPAAYPSRDRDAPAVELLRIPVIGDVFIAILKPFVGRRLLKSSLKAAFSPDPVPDDYLESAAAVWLKHDHVKAFIKHDLMTEASLHKMSPNYGTIKERVIIVTGDSDLAVPARKNAFALHNAIANSELIVIPHAGHQIPETHPEAVLRAINMAVSAPHPE
jgi:pimeloyl-ACP methyl ester carboxylesterase